MLFTLYGGVLITYTSHYIILLSAIECPAGFLRFQGKCYRFSSEAKAYDNARTDCQNTGVNYDLAIIDNGDLNQFLAREAASKDFWFGLADTTNEGTFVWVDGSSLVFSNWGSGEPNNHVR